MWFRSERAGRPLSSDHSFQVDRDLRITAGTDDGRVVMHGRTARIWVMNRSGAEIWDQLAAGRTIDDIAGALSAKYDRPAGEVQQDVIAFATALVTAGVLHPLEIGR